MKTSNLILCVRFCLLLVFVYDRAATLPAISAMESKESAMVKLLEANSDAFLLKTGDYEIQYDQDMEEHHGISIHRENLAEASIRTHIANGQDLNILAAKAVRSIRYSDETERITIDIDSSLYWADFSSTLQVFKKYPGLLRWTALAKVKSPKAFDGTSIHVTEPDCHFFLGKRRADHRVRRYLTPRGPAAGMLFFHDYEMKSTVLYFEDYTSLNRLYEITGYANPFRIESDPERRETLNPNAVAMGAPRYDFQISDRDGVFQTPLTWAEMYPREEKFDRFGYFRPAGFRLEPGEEVVLADTYLYLSPERQDEGARVCRLFCQMLANIYQYIQKPEILETPWADKIAPAMIRELLEDENNWSEYKDQRFLRSYLHHERPSFELLTQGELLLPLTHYVKRFPEQEDAERLKKILDNTLPLYWNDGWKGFGNSLNLSLDAYQSGWYHIFQAVNVSDLALLGNPDAVKMMKGYRDRLLELGEKCGYVFANIRLRDYSQRGFYNFEVTGEYAYVMMNLYTLSGGQDQECLESAKRAIARVAERGFDYVWELNGAMCGSVACYQLYRITGDSAYRDIAYIPLANTLRWAWLWECDYGVGRYVQTFWGFCPTPGNINQAEHESHHARRFLRQFYQLAKQDLTHELAHLIRDSWRYGQSQSRFVLPPYLVESGAGWSMVKEGASETLCGVIDYGSYVPLEDVHVGWCTDDEWFKPNPKNGVVGQEIYGAGGPLWYAIWESEDNDEPYLKEGSRNE